MSLYFALKFLHLVGAAVLLGTGIGTAFFLIMADRTGEPRIVAATLRIVVIADYVFTAASALAQPITGLLLARLAGYALTETWLLLSILLYLVVGACWLRSWRCRSGCATSPSAPPKPASTSCPRPIGG